MNDAYDGKALNKTELLDYCDTKEKVINKQLLDTLIELHASRAMRPATQKNKMPKEIEIENTVAGLRAGIQKVRDFRNQFTQLKDSKEE
jgi:hypothetical protein